MERITQIGLAILFIIGIMTVSAYVYLSLFESRFLSEAILTWIIVLIVVFVALIFEIYDFSEEENEKT